MKSIFISHASADNDAAIKLRNRLKDRGFEGIFLDFHPEEGIPAGRDWAQELYRQVKLCRAVVFLGSERSKRSRWCFAELALSRSLGKPLFPLRIESGTSHPMVDDLQWTDVTQAPEDGYSRLWRGLKEQGVDPQDTFAWESGRSPYPGLSSFQEEDAAVFFGRSEEIQLLFERVNNSLFDGSERFVAVIGPSGGGKSSLVRAGLLPRLRRMGAPWLVAKPFTPQEDPLEMLARSLAKSFDAFGEKADWRSLRNQLVNEPNGLVSVARDLLDSSGEDLRMVLLFIDQAEEIVTLAGRDSSLEFARIIGDALATADVIRVVATLRSEFLTDVLKQSELTPFIQQPFMLPPMPRSRIASVIAGPAKIAEIELAPGLVERIVEDTGGGDALPLMAFTMQRLYQRIVDNVQKKISERDYDTVGGVEGALRQRANVVKKNLAQAGLDAVVIPTLLRLVGIEHGNQPTRRRVRMDTLTEDEEKVIRAFIEARILSTEGVADEAIVYVAHEALLRVWDPIVKAIENHIDELRYRSRLERDARDWDDAGRPDGEGDLLRGGRLERALEWERAQPLVIERLPVVRAFLRASTEFRDRIIAREADLLGNRIINDYEDDPERAILVSLAAMDAYGRRTRLHLALSYAVFGSPRFARMNFPDWVHDLAISPVADTLAAAMGGGSVQMVSFPDGELLWETVVTEGSALDIQVMEVAFTAAGDYLVARCAKDHALYVLESRTGDIAWRLEIGEDVAAMGCSDDYVVAISVKGMFHVWHSRNGFALVREGRFGDEDRVMLSTRSACAAISSDGSKILMGYGKNGFLIELSESKMDAVLQASHSDNLKHMAFSPDEKQVASVGLDGKLIIWPLGSATPSIKVEAGGWIWKTAWSPDGKCLITVDEGRGIRAWNSKTGSPMELRQLRGSKSRALGVSSDGEIFATANNVGRARRFVVSCWEPRPKRPRLRTYIGSAFSQARFADDDRVLVTHSSGYDGDVVLRDALSGNEIKRFKTPRSILGSIVISKDGKQLLVMQDKQVKCLSIPDLTVIRELPADDISKAIFAPALNDEIITATYKGDIRKWEGEEPEMLFNVGECYGSCMSPSHDGKKLLVSTETGIGFFELDSGDEIFSLEGKKFQSLIAEVAPDGSCIAVARDRELRTVKLDGSPLIEFGWGKFNPKSAYASKVDIVSFSPDSKRLATASAEGWVYIWDVPTGELIQLMKVADQPLKDLAFSANGQEIVVCTAKFRGEYDSLGYAEIWSCPDLDHLIEMARERSFRDITLDERIQYGLALPEGTRSDASLFHLRR